MTKHILCSLDLTHTDEAAGLLLEADRQASLDNSKLSVITVIPDYGTSWVGSFFKPGTLKQAAESANEALHELVKTTLPNRKGVKHITKIGVAYEQVLETINELNVDLVILGAHKPDVLDRLLGPNASRIVRSSPVSTMIVRLK